MASFYLSFSFIPHFSPDELFSRKNKGLNLTYNIVQYGASQVAVQR